MPVPLEQFVDQLRASGVLADDTLTDFLPPKSAPQDAEALARELVRQKKLTRFQAEEIYRGKGKSLVLGNYLLLEPIGAGGMGQVFKARHRRMDRLVAVKLLPAALTKDSAAVARFEREVKAAARLRHPNIVAADDADQARGVHFLVMELVDGCDLAALVKESGPLPVDKAINYVLQAARGLEAAHAEGIVHRDIKPANLLLDKKGTVKVLDLGLARIQGENAAQMELTATGTVMGTVDYMAPEQALDTKSADARADIYALGYTLFYLLTGKAAYEGETLVAKLLAHRNQPAPDLRRFRAEVPGPLEAVFKKMVAKEVEDRYQTITEVIAALEACGARRPDTIAEELTLCIVDGTGSTLLLNEVPATTHLNVDEQVLTNNLLATDLLAGELNPVQPLAAAPAAGFPQPPWPPTAVPWATPVAMPVAALPQSPPDAAPLPAATFRRTTQKKEIALAGFVVGVLLPAVAGALLLRSRRDVETPAKPVPRPTQAAAAPQATVNDSGWHDLFDGTSLAGWTGDVGSMSVENGVLVNDGRRAIVIAPGEYRDFEIELEFRLANGGNSGLGICYSGDGDPSQNGLEIQMIDDGGSSGLQDNQKCGSIYQLAPVKSGHFRRWPEWNQLRVTSLENAVRVELNGALVTDATRSLMKQANPQHAGVSRTSGKICLFPIQGRSEYRHIRIQDK
jgi:serine/threonine protein kinase